MNTLIDFELIQSAPDRAMRKVTQALTRAGAAVVKVESDGKKRRVSDVSFREVVMTMADSQQIALRVKATGDIYQVLLNGKLTPIRNQDDTAKAVQEVAAMLDKGRAAFQKRLAAAKVVMPEGIKTAAPKLRDALSQQVAELDAAIAEATQELAELER